MAVISRQAAIYPSPDDITHHPVRILSSASFLASRFHRRLFAYVGDQAQSRRSYRLKVSGLAIAVLSWDEQLEPHRASASGWLCGRTARSSATNSADYGVMSITTVTPTTIPARIGLPEWRSIGHHASAHEYLSN